MVVFECAGCGAALTVALTQVDRPDHEHDEWANSTDFTPPLLPDGTYAAQGDFLVAPGDTRGLTWIPGRYDGDCCGVTGHSGPNLACACGRPVATRVDDCSRWQVVRFAPGAVRAVGEPDPVRPWESVDWDESAGDDWWVRRLEIAAGVAVARVLHAVEGAPVTVPDGPLAEVFRRSFDARRSPGEPRTLGLAGPGVVGEADVLLVPRHPQTGEAWPVAGTSVPIPAELWVLLARPARVIVPKTGGRWAAHLRDVPEPPRPADVEPASCAIRRESAWMSRSRS
ncbi:hypothetical protein [Lentzea sp. NPDC003310]|uniref:hypothetical protein n=1 Tax=Lentzea sp. NPDC003310 TaxID=3154447 RepID=UPI0033B1A16E